jgi:NADH-quinone oxidoreductase subunit K
MAVTLNNYLILALILFVIGFISLILSTNRTHMLISLLVIFSSININLIAFTSFKNYISLSGTIFAFLIMFIISLQVLIGFILIHKINKENKE